MVELTAMDIRKTGESGESGRVLIDRLIRIDRLVAPDPGTCVIMLVRRSRLDGAAEDIRRRAAAYFADPQDSHALVDITCRKGRGTQRFQPSLERILWEHMCRTLARHGGNRKATAQTLKITDNTLRRRLALRPPLA
jgi:ActR/RegA family two-component response regulator